MTCVLLSLIAIAELSALSRSVQPSDLRLAKVSRIVVRLLDVAETGFSKIQSQFTSHAATLIVSFSVNALNSDASSAFCVARWPWSIDADVSARINSRSGSLLGTSGRSQLAD